MQSKDVDDGDEGDVTWNAEEELVEREHPVVGARRCAKPQLLAKEASCDLFDGHLALEAQESDSNDNS